VLAVLGQPLLAALPLPVLAGILLALAVSLFDPWTLALLRRTWRGDAAARTSLALVVGVMAATLGAGLAAGVALGALLSLLLFAVRMNRSLVRRRYRGAAQPSRRMRMPAVEALLQPLRQRVLVLELEGALFFGSSPRLLAEAAALPAGCAALLLDAERVSAIDDTGAQALHDLQRLLARRGAALRIAGLRPALRAQVGDLDALASPDIDRALEWAEALLLAGRAEVPAQVALDDTTLMQPLAPPHRALLARHLVPLQLAAGETLFDQGDPGDRLYVLLSGSVSVLTRADAQGRSRRFLSLSPGTMLGETALLDGGGRSAGAVADEASTLVALDAAALAALQAQHPEVAAPLYRAIGVHLAQRLRQASARDG
jgi:anti-anti-sigma regulatory factor